MSNNVQTCNYLNLINTFTRVSSPLLQKAGEAMAPSPSAHVYPGISVGQYVGLLMLTT